MTRNSDTRRTSHGPLGLLLRTLGIFQLMPALRAVDLGLGLVAVVALAGCSPSSSPSSAAAPPAIVTQPAPVTVADGAVAHFMVTTTGDPVLAHQWRRNGVDLSDGPGVSGATTDALALTAPYAFDASQISVRVTNTAGSVLSDDALLTVTAASTMSPGPDGGTPIPGSGRTWGPAVEISNSAYSDLRGSPRVGIDATGSAVAVWLEALADHTRNAVWASRYSAGGAWSTPATIDNAVGSSSAPQLAIAPSGAALVAFGQSDSNQGGARLLVTNRFTGTWGTPTTISSPGQTPDNPFLALGNDGAAAVVYTASDGMVPRAWAARSSAAGMWDAPMVMESTAQPGWAPSVTISTNGDAVMTWSETGGALSDTSLWASRNQGGVWSAPVLLSTDVGAVLGSIVVGADASGDVLAIWSQRLAGLYTLRSARMSAGTGAWSAPVTVNDGTREVTAPQLSVDTNGDAAAVWFETNHGVVASRYTSSTAKWGSPVVVQAKSTGLVSYPVPNVGMDAKGNAVATWVQPVGGPPRPHLFAAHSSSASSGWTAPIDLLADPSAALFPAETHLSVNEKGEAILVWHQDAGMPSAPGIWARVYR